MSFMENFEKELNGMRASEGKSAVKVSSGSKSSSKSTTKKKKKNGFMDNFYEELSSIADDDIGPVYDRARNRMTVKSDDEEDDSKLDFFQKGLFEDGYQAGDITKTILGTAGDAALGVVKGVGSLVEGVVDLGQYGVAGVADLLGKEETAKDWKEAAKWNLVDSVTKDASDYLDKYSVLGRTSEAILQGVGQVGGIVATGGLGAAAGLGTAGTTALTTGVMGLSSMGSGMGEAYQGGATDEEAVTYGLISGAADALTEMMFGGMGKAVNAIGLSRGLSSADDMLAKAISKKFTKQIAKNFAEFGVKASAEGLEEVVAGVAQAMGKKFTYMSEKDMKDILEDENLLEQFVVGSATSGMIQSGIIPGTKKGSLIEANQNESDFLTGTTKNEQAVIRKEVENRVAAEEQSGKKLTKKEKATIEEQVVRDLEKGYISTDTIEEVLGGSTYDIYKGTVDSEDAILREYEELGQKTNATLKDQARYTELTQKVKDIREKSQRDALKTQLGEEVFNLVKGDRLAESYNERARRGQAFQADLTKYDAKQQAVIQKAIDSGILNNTNRTHEFVDLVSKISADKGVLFDFTNNQKLKDSGFAVEGKQVNGYVTKDGITLNIDSKKALETTVGHEITHVLEGTEVYDALKQTIFDYAKARGEYQGRYDSLTELYKDVKDADIEGELTADLVGDYLFSDTDFISNLSTKNRNVFQKIYDEIKYLCKIATAGSKEARELERVRKAFEDAYRAGGESQNETKYSISEETDTNYLDAVSRGDTDTAQKMVDEAAKNAGYTIKAYHGTKDSFTVFERGQTNQYDSGYLGSGFYFTDNKDSAKDYSQWKKGYDGSRVINASLQMKNPLVIEDTAKPNLIAVQEALGLKLTDFGNALARPNKAISDAITNEAKKQGYDGIVRYSEFYGETTYVVFDSNQVKSADPVTYDDSGNVIPLSQRFNAENKDIRYSLSSEGLSEADKQDALKVVKNLNTRAMASRYTSNFATYTPERMDREIERSSSATVMDYAKSYITWVDPFDFIYATTTSDRGREQLREEAGALDIEKLRGETQPIHLTVDFETGRIVGHEGRHRMLALQAEDVRHVAVIIDAWNDNRSQTKPISMMKLQGQQFSQYEQGTGFYLHDLLPLSKRYADTARSLFTNKSRYGGVQFSLSDSNGRQLTAEQQEYFKDSKVRDENGNLKGMYHGTPNGSFTVFKDGTYFTDRKEYADRYQNPGASSISTGKEAKNPKTFEVYLDIKKPFDINDAEAREIYINDYIKGGNAIGINPYLSDAEYAMINTIDWTEGEDLRDFLIENEYDYDGLVLDEGGTGGYGDEVHSRGKSYVVFSPEQVKNVDNLKPTEDPDIRFSLSKSVEETKELLALHNLTEQKLLKSLKLGGLPMPSVAIAKAKDGHSEFGEISLILPRDSIDPETSSRNKLYSGDAWTPTYPKVDYKLNSKALKQIRDKINSLVPSNIQEFGRLHLDSDNMEDTLNRYGGDMVDAFKDNDALKYAYLMEAEADIQLPMKEKNLSYSGARENGAIIKVAEAISSEDINKALNGGSEEIRKLEPVVRKAVAEYVRETYGDDQFILDTFAPEDGLSFSDLDGYLVEARKYLRTGVEQTVDTRPARELIRDMTVQYSYEEWLRDLFSGIAEKEGIRNDKDYFTPSGNRRSFEALHYEHNLENVIKAMREKGEKGIGFGGGSIFGAATTEFSSVDEMKRASGRLQQMTEEEYQEIKDGFTNRFFELASSLPKNKSSFMATDDAANTLVEAVAKYNTKRGIANYLKRELDGWANYSPQVVDDLLELVNDIRSMPTGYFEAKPQRAVGFDEVGVFVIPYDADVKLKQELLNRGYSIAEYDPKVEGDRQRVVNQFEEYKFSLSNVGEAPVRPNYRATMGGDIALEGIAPVAENTTVQQETQLTEDKSTLSETETVDEAPLPDSGEEVKQTRKQYHQTIIDRIRGTFKTKGFDFDNVLKNAKNLSTWSTVDNTPQRVMEKALGYKAGGVLADITVNKVAQNESEGIKWVNRNVATLKQISRQYHIKPGSKESAAAQMYAEGFYVNKNNEIVRYGDPELIQDFKNPEVRRNIKGLARDPRIRKIYDDTLASINESRTRNLYPEIPRLDNYFLHFRAMTDTFSTLGLPFNPNDIRAKDLPTDLNGVTADLKPGQPYFASAMHREGKRTSFDLLGGVERYLNSAKNQIYHIDDIQTLRALRNHIAETYGQATGLEDIDSLSDAEAEERIKQVYGAHLSTFAKFLNEEANVLAGKTALIDRGLEGIIGRRGITFLNTLNQQVGSNMVGYNVSSSLTNFLPVAQTFAKTNKFDFVKAFAQTAANKVSGGRLDSFTEDSPVVIRRKGQDRFYQTPWQKMQNPGYALMGMVDDISTELIARTKYNEFVRKGMDSQKAHFETDKWVSRLMGDRSLGQMPQLYNSKMLGLITKFQLEVRNQLDAQFYDTVQETKVSNEHIRNGLARNARTAAQVASTFAQLAVVQHLFGMAFESVAGYNSAFDIIEVLMTAFGYDDEEDSEDTALDNFAQGLLALAEDMPYASTFTGGRIPISEAIPDVNAILRGEDEYGNEIGIPQAIVENAKEIAPYYLMPAGFGQMKKTKAGLDMFSDEHPIAGSYTDAGNLRFPVEDTMKNRIHAGIFGQYANENARKYFDQEQRTLNPDQTAIFAELDMPIEDYWEYRDNLYAFYDAKDRLEEDAEADGATDEDVLKSRYAKSVYSDINKLYSQQKEIAGGNSLLKQDQLRDIQSQMEKMLSESKSAVDNISVSGAYAEVGDRRYNYDAEEDTWYEIKPKNADGSDNYYYQQEQEITKKFGISYSEYWNNRDEYSFAYSHPKEYALAKAIGGYDAYADHYDALENWKSDSYIASDKDKYGDSISGSRKKKVQAYIDGLDISDIDKILLFKSVYTSYDDYNSEIIDYLNSRKDLSYEEKEFILVKLGAKVDSEGYIEW